MNEPASATTLTLSWKTRHSGERSQVDWGPPRHSLPIWRNVFQYFRKPAHSLISRLRAVDTVLARRECVSEKIR